MKLKEFIEDLQEAAAELNVEDPEVTFASSPVDRWLVASIYNTGEKETVCIDLFDKAAWEQECSTPSLSTTKKTGD
jgi:hypothetical protein